MRPFAFFAGLICGLFSLFVAGSGVRNTSLARNFVRFHFNMNVESGFMPTAAELATIINQQPAPRVYVIVGGSSVLNGVGQRNDLVWSRRLQNALGRDFLVINFANRAGGSIDFGSVAAEMLLRQNRPVIYLADANETLYANDLPSSPYRYMIFDGWMRSYLVPWPPRDAYLRWAPLDQDQRLRSAALGEWLNFFLRFNELWNYVGYNVGGLQWNRVRTINSYSPIKDRPDPEMDPEFLRSIRYRANKDAELAIVASQASRPIQKLLASKAVTEEMVPPQLRSLTLVVIQLVSPYYLDAVPGSREALVARASELQSVMRDMGFRKVIIPASGFTENDYVDRLHLSVEGGNKLAIAVAPAVRQMAMDLGYLQ
jgi:hypothetical protein